MYVGYSKEGDAKVNNDPLPTPYELNDAPELAVLAVLDTAIEAATRALAAIHPELWDDWGPRCKQEPAVSACRLLSRAHKLQVALARYRRVVLRDPPTESGAADGLDVPSARAPEAF